MRRPSPHRNRRTPSRSRARSRSAINHIPSCCTKKFLAKTAVLRQVRTPSSPRSPSWILLTPTARLPFKKHFPSRRPTGAFRKRSTHSRRSFPAKAAWRWSFNLSSRPQIPTLARRSGNRGRSSGSRMAGLRSSVPCCLLAKARILPWAALLPRSIDSCST